MSGYEEIKENKMVSNKVMSVEIDLIEQTMCVSIENRDREIKFERDFSKEESSQV